jgi:hypothetical protein
MTAPQKVPLRYVGSRPDGGSDYAVMNKSQVDDAYQSKRIDDAYVSGAVQDVLPALAPLTYVTEQDAQRAAKTDVTAADATRVPLSNLSGVSGGVVPLNESASVPPGRVPANIKTHRAPFVQSASTVNLTGNQVMAAPIGPKQFLAASLTIADPGYSYIPLPFAVVRGGALEAVEAVTRSMTTASYGQLSVLDTANVRYGWAVCGGRKVYDFHTLLPFADERVNPTTHPIVDGPLTLNLWLGLYGGSTYTFTPTGLQFYVLVYPGVA